MSTINSAEKEEWYNTSKLRAYMEAGLQEAGENEDGEKEYLGTTKQWKEAERLWEYMLDNPDEF